MKMHKTV